MRSLAMVCGSVRGVAVPVVWATSMRPRDLRPWRVHTEPSSSDVTFEAVWNCSAVRSPLSLLSTWPRQANGITTGRDSGIQLVLLLQQVFAGDGLGDGDPLHVAGAAVERPLHVPGLSFGGEDLGQDAVHQIVAEAVGDSVERIAERPARLGGRAAAHDGEVPAGGEEVPVAGARDHRAGVVGSG